MKAVILATAMAVGFASYASAAEVKKDTKAPVVAGKAMTDKDMDKVTAGGAEVTSTGPGAFITLPGQASPTANLGGIGRANGAAGTNPATLSGAGL